ncbi:MAG TPA: prepilin peptidase [Bacillales bacterium]|nr:prepilin peptidase [Bacillales bacterium]
MLFNGLLILILLVCMYTDIKSRKIYNKVVYPGVFAALVCHLFMDGWGGLLQSFLGLCVGFAILLIPYLLGGMGAGDVKLLALVGAFNGTVFVLQTSVYMAFVGALMAVFILLFRKGRLRAVLFFLFSRMNRVKVPLSLDKSNKMYPYGVAIACGAFVTLILDGKLIVWL